MGSGVRKAQDIYWVLRFYFYFTGMAFITGEPGLSQYLINIPHLHNGGRRLQEHHLSLQYPD
jgi:hypothetical protein